MITAFVRVYKLCRLRHKDKSCLLLWGRRFRLPIPQGSGFLHAYLHDGPRSRRIRQIVTHGNRHPDPQFPALRGGFGDLALRVRSLVEEYSYALLQRRGKKIEHLRDRRQRARRDHVHLACSRQFFRPPGREHGVGQGQLRQRRFHKTRLLPDRFGEREARLGKRERQGNTRKTGAGSRIEHMLRLREQPPRHDGIEDVLDGRLARSGDTGQVEVPVRFLDQSEVRGALRDDHLTVRKVRGQNPIQLAFERHDS